MNNNVFSFANKFWIQLSDIAISNPTACTYAITYDHHENSKTLATFQANLLY